MKTLTKKIKLFIIKTVELFISNPLDELEYLFNSEGHINESVNSTLSNNRKHLYLVK